MQKIILLLFTVFILSQISANATVTILNCNTNYFPNVEMKFMLVDDWNRIVTNVDTVGGNIRFYDNGQRLNLTKFNQAKIKNDTSFTVIAFDLGIGNRTNNVNDFNDAKFTLTQCISYFNDENSKILLTSYADIPSIEVDWTSDLPTVANFVNELSQTTNSNIFRSFTTFATGSFSILEEVQSENKSILLVTQGIISNAETQLIIAQAKQIGAKINVLYFGKNVPENIKKIANETNGFCINQNDLAKSRLPFLATLAKLCEGFQPYEIAANTNINCDGEHLFEIRTNDFSSSEFLTTVEQIKLSAIESNPNFLEFPSVQIGTSSPKNITLTAKVAPIRITNIYTDNPLFQLGNMPNLPRTLQINEELSLTVSYNPLDSSIAFSRLIVVSDACLYDTVYLTGGFPNVPPNQKTIHFTSPKCDDVLVIGDTVNISWRGVLPKDVVSIISERHSNELLDTFARNVVGLNRDFVVPDIGEDSLRFFINQLWPNSVGKTLDFRHDSLVKTAFFNKREDKIITTTASRKVTIWNSNSGEKIYEFPQFPKPVQWAKFCGVPNSVEDKYIGIACRDSTVYFYDAQNYELKFSHRINNELPNSVEFSPDGKYAVVAIGDGYGQSSGVFEVIDMNTGEVKTSQKMTFTICTYAQFNPAKEYEIMALTWHDGIIRFFDIDGNQTDSVDLKIQLNEEIEEEKDKITNLNSNYATFNSDGTKILYVNFTLSNVQLIDRNTKKILYSINHPVQEPGPSEQLINFASFFDSPTENYILTSGMDFSLRRWNTADGSPSVEPYEFWEHKQVVNTGVFNGDGWRVLSASNDHTAKIWNLNQRTLQADTTCFIRVAYARATVMDTIDLGSIYIGETGIRTVENCFENICDFAYSIKSIRIVGENPADFDLLDLDNFEFPLRINANSALEFNVIFRPQNVDLRTARIQIIIPNDTLYIVLRGIGINVGLSQITSIIDFGYVEIDDYSDTVVAVAVNVSGGDIDINDIYISGPQAENFRNFWTNSNSILQNEDTLFLPLRFFPLDFGRKNAVLYMKHSLNNFPMRWNLVGTGAEIFEDTVVIRTENISAEIGQTVTFPIWTETILNTENEQNSGINLDSIILSFSFNSSLLFPTTFSNEVKILRNEVENGIKTLTVSIPFKFGKQRIDGLQFLATFGNAIESEIQLRNISTVGKSRIFIRHLGNSTFTVLNPCEADGIRLFDERGRLELSQNKPNPATNEIEIEFEILENGISSLKIFDISGAVVRNIFDEYKSAGSYSISISTKDLPRGIYYYSLETLTKTLTKIMILE